MNTVVALIIYGTIIGLLVYFKRQQQLFFAITFILNYFIMGIERYVSIPVPISILMEGFWIVLLVILLCNKNKYRDEGKIPVKIFAIYGIWTIYTTLEIINNTCGIGLDIAAWFKDVRFYGFDPLIVMLIFSLIFRTKEDIKKFIILWGILLILCFIRCFAQVNFGFDKGESLWLNSVGYHTHVLRAGTLIRYFSFFSDAANLGAHTAIGFIIFGILFLQNSWKNIKLKCFYLIVSLCSMYCMFLSGARAGMIVAICCAIAYVFLSRNWKMFSYTTIVLIIGVFLLVFTNIGNGIQSVRRMRSAFQGTEEASMEVRKLNQKAIESYMREAPFGIGLGKDASNIPPSNRYYIVAITPPDSTIIYLWMRTGSVGVFIYLFVNIILLIGATFIVWFRIKDKELRTIAGIFTAGSAAWLVAGYGNHIYFQYPNTMIFFGMQTLIYMMPYFDKKLLQEQLLKNKNEEEKEVEEIEELQEGLETT
ncbi:MAG: O-antigen ligase family protein [Bacteroidales bacterium]|nr:O-antigen ligase family protein [Candidatus Minthousia equi]